MKALEGLGILHFMALARPLPPLVHALAYLIVGSAMHLGLVLQQGLNSCVDVLSYVYPLVWVRMP